MSEIKTEIKPDRLEQALRGPVTEQSDGFVSARIGRYIVKDLAPMGRTYWFEYHCWESPESSDAEVWYHSHQQVEVIGVASECGAAFTTIKERADAGEIFCYQVRFQDGLEWTVFEDELLTSREHFERLDPPQPGR